MQSSPPGMASCAALSPAVCARSWGFRTRRRFPDLAMASAVRAAEGDFRNWAQIRDWANRHRRYRAFLIPAGELVRISWLPPGTSRRRPSEPGSCISAARPIHSARPQPIAARIPSCRNRLDWQFCAASRGDLAVPKSPADSALGLRRPTALRANLLDIACALSRADGPRSATWAPARAPWCPAAAVPTLPAAARGHALLAAQRALTQRRGGAGPQPPGPGGAAGLDGRCPPLVVLPRRNVLSRPGGVVWDGGQCP
jgi:hypothetical protein